MRRSIIACLLTTIFLVPLAACKPGVYFSFKPHQQGNSASQKTAPASSEG